ncbi:alpha/beta fold hydrolase [Streptomyces yaanensis]|uniref:Alpha/beta fold hydrolase n=1 Tax=Streptomyces yaanensis TaxID=1142239 RepID=A0ABV7SNC1_9ACTN|nr:alpha/beta fold hydrolase [Streptomyces sp. CGMCC 4.7035]WNC02994.1 alpha/beta fold hydrolase [Streptomyces sp. CGMCC 4.7035]
MHPGGGVSWCYMPMSRFAPSGIPLYALQARGISGEAEFAASLTEMAQDYIEQMRTVQPTGPYRLLGWSHGGLVAHEVAVQLQAAGDEVSALIILDVYPPQRTLGPEPVEGDGEGGAAEAELMPAPDPEGELRALKDWARQVAGPIGGLSDDEALHIAHLFLNNQRIAVEHNYGRFDGDALVLVAEEGKTKGAPTARSWEPYVSGTISEARIPCAHPQMVDPEQLSDVWHAIADWMAAQED